jgi:hypothetical protein
MHFQANDEYSLNISRLEKVTLRKNLCLKIESFDYDEDYYRNASCTQNWVSTFLLLEIYFNSIFVGILSLD